MESEGSPLDLQESADFDLFYQKMDDITKIK